MACILQSIQRNTVTLTAGLTFIDIGLGVPLTDLTRAELVIDAKTAQSTVNLTNMFVTGRLTSTTNVRIERGGSAGAMVVHFTVIEYTVASGVVVDRDVDILNATTKDIAVTSRPQANSYSRMYFKTSLNSNFKAVMMTHNVTSDTNVQILGDGIDTSISFDWQRVTIPSATVSRFTVLATGTSFPVNITGLGIVPAEAYCISSMKDGAATGIDDDEFKIANLVSTTQCNLDSNFGDSHTVVLQIVQRTENRVERGDSTFSATSFNVNWLNPVDWNCSFINLAIPNNNCSTATFSNDAGEFMIQSQLNGDFAITLGKFSGVQTVRVISEVVYIDANIISVNGFRNLQSLYKGAFRNG
jgi:hypothetical protein